MCKKDPPRGPAFGSKNFELSRKGTFCKAQSEEHFRPRKGERSLGYTLKG